MVKQYAGVGKGKRNARSCIANKTEKAPRKPYSIQEALTYLGQLVGPKHASSDGPLELKTVWMGLITLKSLLAYRDWMP